MIQRLQVHYPEAANRYPDEFNSEKQYREHLTYSAVCRDRILADPLAAAAALARSVVQDAGDPPPPCRLRLPNLRWTPHLV